jgi:hypothetical protein
MKRLVVVVVTFLSLTVSGTSVAMADKKNEPCRGDESCQGKQGDCRDVEKGAHCEDNDLSPSFKDSPVDRSFNPVICLPMSTCNFDGSRGGEEQPPSQPQ